MVETPIELNPDDEAIFRSFTIAKENQIYKLRQNDIRIRSEEQYLKTVKDVVNFSKQNLQTIHDEKLDLRCRLVEFCLQILSIQLVFLIVFLLFAEPIGLSDDVLSVYMAAVFVETLGAIIVMIKYAFKSDEEVKIIDILNAVVKNFQIYRDTKKDDKHED